MKAKAFLDIECYRNYFLIYFKGSKGSKYLEIFNNEAQGTLNFSEVKTIMCKYTTIGFNSKNYDLPVLAAMFKKADNSYIKSISDEIITSDKKVWEVVSDNGLLIPKSWDHVDLIEIPRSLVEDVKNSRTGLKLYGARMHTKKLQDLPIEPDQVIEDWQRDLLREYCINDLFITEQLYENLKEDIILREKIGAKYNLDLRSKSKSQIAEAVVRSELKIKKVENKVDVEAVYKYETPKSVTFKSHLLQNLAHEFCSYDFRCTELGKLIKPETLTKRKILLKDTEYTIGLGGIHSNESSRKIEVQSGEFLLDLDVVSYYPSMILNNDYAPKLLKNEFLNLYRHFYEDRLLARDGGDVVKSTTYKYVLVGSYGKFGSIYSCLFSPESLFSITLTGQLSLLMLIENIIELTDCDVVSANTDGVTVFGKISDLTRLKRVVENWQKVTRYKLEEVYYKALYSEHVNRYIAVKENGGIKSKGFGASSLDKNPDLEVCYDAVVNYIKGGSFTIGVDECDDIRKFLKVERVREGALWKNEYLGKVVRWYYSDEGEKIIKAKSGNKVPDSDFAVPCMVLPDTLPKNLDKGFYVQKTHDLLKCLGVVC